MAREYRKFVREDVETAVKDSSSLCEVLRKLGRSPVGGNSTNLSLTLKRWGVDTSHFDGQAHNKGKPSFNKKAADDHLRMGTTLDRRAKGSVLSRCLLEKGVEYKCNCCGVATWLGKPLKLEVDHIDGQYWNNLFGNLQFLCPNCHAMKD